MQVAFDLEFSFLPNCTVSNFFSFLFKKADLVFLVIKKIVIQNNLTHSTTLPS